MDGPIETNICIAIEFVVLEALLQALPKRRALLLVQAATDLFTEDGEVTPITASLVSVGTRRAAAELWREKLPDVMRRLR